MPRFRCSAKSRPLKPLSQEDSYKGNPEATPILNIRVAILTHKGAELRS